MSIKLHPLFQYIYCHRHSRLPVIRKDEGINFREKLASNTDALIMINSTNSSLVLIPQNAYPYSYYE